MFVYFIELTTRVMQHGSSSAAQLYRMPAARETWLVHLLQLYCAQFDAAYVLIVCLVFSFLVSMETHRASLIMRL